MEPFEVMISESQERMLCVVEPDKLDEVLAVCEKWEVRATAIGDGHRHAPAACARSAARSWATCRSRRSSTTARSTTSTRSSRREPVYPAPAAKLDGARVARRTRCSRCSRRPTSRRSGGRSSSTTGSSGRARRAARRRPTPRCCMLEPDGGTGAIAVSIDGNGRRVACDPYTRRRRGRARVRAQPRLRRGGAARPHELPELRQPREAAHRLAADARGRGAARRLPRASARRWWAATSRSTTRAAAGRSTRRRSSGWSASCPTRATVPWSAFREPGHAIALVGPFAPVARRLGAREAAGRALDASCRRSTWTRTPPRSTRSASAVRSGVVATAHDVSEGGLACALAECAIAGAASARQVDARRATSRAVRRGTRRRAARGAAARRSRSSQNPCNRTVFG